MDIRCPKCTEIQPSAKFCRNCGVKFEIDSIPAPLPPQKKGNNLLAVILIVIGSIVALPLFNALTSNNSPVTTKTVLPSPSTAKTEPTPFPLDVNGQILRIASEGSSAERISQNIAKIDKSITYEHLKKSAEKYAGKEWAFKGKILEITESDKLTTARIALDDYGNKVVFVSGYLTTDFVEKNEVYVVGYLAGNYNYTSQANWQISIPALAARAIIKPGEVAKYQSK